MAHITKRLGRWQATYRGPDKRERTKTFDRRIDAERFLREVESAKDRGQWIDPKLGRITFGEWAERWWATTASNRASTRARDLSYMRTHITPGFGAMPLATIDHLAVRTWVAELASRRAPATVAKAFQIMSKVMQAAVDAKLIVSSPCANVPLPRVEREEMRFCSPTEVARLAGAIHPRYRALVLVGAYAGLRVGELAGLKRSRVDVLRRRIDVAEIVVEVQGHLIWGPPKTRAGRRSITLPRQIMDELVAHMERWAGPELVFTAPEGGVLRVNAWRRRYWNPAVRAAGLEPLRPHDLKHTAVSIWVAQGANVLEVSRRAGHTSPAFSMSRYGHLFGDADEALADRLDAVVVTPGPDAEVVPLNRKEAQ